MPRKPLIYTHEFPYHVCARSNNKDWFHLPIDQCWEIFSSHLNELTAQNLLHVHAFVLMHNHYHLLATTPSPDSNLGHVMCWLQRETARTINRDTGRINHIFGGSYKACLIRSEYHYAHAVKYVYRNPVEAGICATASGYRFSTLNQLSNETAIDVIAPLNGIHAVVPSGDSLRKWLDQPYEEAAKKTIQIALTKTEFKLRTPKRDRPHPLNSKL